jgi:RND family efflux transporter MFP subunit
MKRTKILVLLSILLIVVLVVLKLRMNKQEADSRVYTYEKDKSVLVETDTIQKVEIVSLKLFPGSFEPEKESRISSDVPGKIVAVWADIGSNVTKGQPLLQLDTTLLALQLKAVEVQLGGLETDVNRFTILAKADAIQGVQLEKAVLGLEAAKVQQATILAQIKKSTVRAPFSGIITAKLAEAGAYAAPGIPLLQLTDLRQLRFTLNVSEQDLPEFSIGKFYRITSDVFPELSLNGRLLLIGSKASQGNSFPIQLAISNTPELKLKSGMFGKVHISKVGLEKQILIPSAAIQGTAGSMRVFVVKNGKAVSKPITTGGTIANQTIVTTGLEEGELIITSGFINLLENAFVQIK